MSCYECTQSAKDSSVDGLCYVNCPVERSSKKDGKNQYPVAYVVVAKRVISGGGYLKKFAGKFTS